MGTALTILTGQHDRHLAMVQSVQDNYRPQVAAWIRWMIETGNGIDQDGILEYFRWLRTGSGYRASTIRVKRQAVKARVRQLFHDADDSTRGRIDRMLADLDHDHDTKAPSIQSAPIERDKVLDTRQYQDLLTAAGSTRQALFIRFLAETGCRVSEMIGARLERCEVSGQAVKITIMGKGSKERTVRLRLSTFEDIRATFAGLVLLFETATGQAYSRSYISGQVKKAGRRIGLNISAHSLRHSFASNLVQALPGKLDAVSRYLGHSNPSITLSMYCHSSLSDDELLLACAS